MCGHWPRLTVNVVPRAAAPQRTRFKCPPGGLLNHAFDLPLVCKRTIVSGHMPEGGL